VYLLDVTRPTYSPDMTLAAYLDALDAWKDQGDWVPACNGTEVPFTTRSGARLLYVWQPRSGRHAYLDCGTDIVLTYDEAMNLMGNSMTGTA
jgi:hypothetical protein